jgi:rSAM/selenodomain-associated transferase 2/rSAM/selenodomain-associated transferase 1
VPNPTDQAHLIIFGRYPAAGRTKTRLIPALGPAGAAALQKQLTEKTVKTAHQSLPRGGVRLALCYEGGDMKRFQRWLGKGVDYSPQASGDIGRRMFLAIQKAYDQGAGRIVLIGTDIPGITSDILDRAFASLKDHDLVLGPSTDGGYWLVGMTRPENIFAGIAWSRADVLERTLKVARQKRLNVCLLDPLTDLDTPEDLSRTPGWQKPCAPYLSVIIPVLNEERQLARTISAAASVDAQIIVSDGGSTDHSLAIARSLEADIVSGQPGRAVQQNRGVTAARGEVLLFLHADTRLPRDYVAHIFETLMDRRTVMGAFRFDTDLQTPARRWISFWTNRRAAWLNLPYGDQGLFLRRRDFFNIGGFPEVAIAEDLYFARTAARHGRIALAPAAVITSARRWRRLGALRTTLINTIIAAGCLAGVAPDRLAPMYRSPLKKQ